MTRRNIIFGLSIISLLCLESDKPRNTLRESIDRVMNNINEHGQYVVPGPANDYLHCVGGWDYEGTNQYCQIDSSDEEEKKIIEHCSKDPSCIGFPNYSVTDRFAEIPVLGTEYIRECTGIVIYDSTSHYGLMAHLLDGGKSAGIPNARYVQFFRDNYFFDVPSSELTVYLAFGNHTSRASIVLFERAINEYFPEANVFSERITNKACHKGDLLFDTRTGYYEASSREINMDGFGSVRGFCFPGSNNIEVH
jgi:hypothetical protein